MWSMTQCDRSLPGMILRSMCAFDTLSILNDDKPELSIIRDEQCYYRNRYDDEVGPRELGRTRHRNLLKVCKMLAGRGRARAADVIMTPAPAIPGMTRVSMTQQ